MITVTYHSVIMTICYNTGKDLRYHHLTLIFLRISRNKGAHHLLSTFCCKYIFYAYPGWFQIQKLMTAVWRLYYDNDTQSDSAIYLQLTTMSIKVLIYWEITLRAARPLTFASFFLKKPTKQSKTILDSLLLQCLVIASQ